VTPAAAQPPASAPPDSTAAAEPAPVEVRVGRVSVMGNVAVDSARILRSFEVPPGSRYSDEMIRRGFRKLFALGLFDDIRIERLEREGDPTLVDLVIHVRERPRIGRIEFTGNKKRETSELEKKIKLKPGDVYSPTVVRTEVDSLLRYYRDEGFALATVTAHEDSSTTGGTFAIRFEIHEGEKVKIEDIRFEGAHSLDLDKLKKQLKSKRQWMFGGGEVKEENLVEDREKLEHYYRSNGFRDFRVVSANFEPGSTAKRVVLHVVVDEGPRYRFGTVQWTGNKIVPTAVLSGFWAKGKDSVYDASRIEKTQGQIYAEYSEHGYLYLGVEPRETVRDSLVDVTFVVTEGRPSNIRYVVVSGNKGTREKVIRREIDLHEGDQFRRSALMRSRDDIMRLGLFEDVGLDFTPADSTDVDLQIKVKEKQVGTASAGAGYTSEAGVTGFLELGHTNVLGNGQALNLHLERGGKRANYFLSFTEPWFHDTPTLLGFTAFNSTNDRDLYEEKRVGGSGRIGRPLRWPDFSRGSVMYRLERVTIDQLRSTLTPADSVALSSVNVGQPTLTSSVELSLLRNTTDSPFYPTRGSRFMWSSELAGGPFGGSINFHKHRIEGRSYRRSIVPSFVTMLRARFGILGRYADQKIDVPTYERFRLGGGTTIDPLRGYDDYMVVPEKFIQDVVVGQRPVGIDTTTVPGDTSIVYQPLYQKVRYPGGRFMIAYTVEQQFPIVHPLHGVLFFDAGNTWDARREVKPFDLKMGAGFGFRMEIPLLGNIGFDYGYGFNRDDRPKWVGHFLIGQVSF
jgi:outer membrane protein insertion porin family